jgi:hypothetical protein
MDRFGGALVEKYRELLLAEDLGKLAGGGIVTGRQRGEGQRVHIFRIALARNQLARPVYEHRELGVGLADEGRQDLVDAGIILFEKHKFSARHTTSPRV